MMPLPHVSLDLSEPTAKEISAVGEWLARIDAAASAALPGYSHLVITPLGMPARPWLEGQLLERGIDIEARVHIADWQRVSTAIHVTGRSAERLRTAALFEAAWKKLRPSAAAEAWRIDLKSHARIAEEKLALRSHMDNIAIEFRPGETSELHAFHLADVRHALAAARRLEASLATQ